MPDITITLTDAEVARLRGSGETDTEAIARVVQERTARETDREVRDWWDSLTPTQKLAVYQREQGRP